jgi:glycosyltransferase involved in cell wall biosynthesis
LEKLLTDKDLRTRLAKQGKRRAETDYSIDSMCKNYERLLHSLVEAGTA